MKRKKKVIAGIAVLVIIALAFAGYNIYRYPAMLRNLSDNSLNDSQVEEVKEEILSGSDIKVLVAYFSYSGTTKNVATALSEKTGGDLFEIAAQDGYSDVYQESNREIRNNDRPLLTNTVPQYGRVRHCVCGLSGMVARNTGPYQHVFGKL